MARPGLRSQGPEATTANDDVPPLATETPTGGGATLNHPRNKDGDDASNGANNDAGDDAGEEYNEDADKDDGEDSGDKADLISSHPPVQDGPGSIPQSVQLEEVGPRKGPADQLRLSKESLRSESTGWTDVRQSSSRATSPPAQRAHISVHNKYGVLGKDTGAKAESCSVTIETKSDATESPPQTKADKGKGPDPANWGWEKFSAAEMDPQIQADAMRAYNKQCREILGSQASDQGVAAGPSKKQPTKQPGTLELLKEKISVLEEMARLQDEEITRRGEMIKQFTLERGILIDMQRQSKQPATYPVRQPSVAIIEPQEPGFVS